jgi:hypothetical protein
MKRRAAVRTTLGAGLMVVVGLTMSMAPAASASPRSAGHTSAAGPPTSTNDLFCGTYTPGSASAAGQSSIDKVNSSASGSVYPYTGQTCEQETSNGSFQPGSDMFMWTVAHSTVNTSTERGTEHGFFVLASNGRHAGVNGRVTDYDFGSTSDFTCSDGRTLFYASGRAYDACGQPSAPGDFNTQGGAQLGQHYRGMYGTIVYQDSNNNACKPGSTTYCFEAILKGQTN